MIKKNEKIFLSGHNGLVGSAILKVKFDNNKKLDGVKRKVLDTSLATMYGWKPKIKLEDAILKTFNDLKKNFNKVRN